MPLPFSEGSSLTWLQAKTRVARSSGSQDDDEMKIAAGWALEEAIRNWEHDHNWRYMLVDSSFTSTGIVSGTLTFTPVTATDLRSMAVGMTVSGTISGNPIPAGTTISAIGATTMTLSQAATNGVGNLTFGYAIANGTQTLNLPGDFHNIYNARLITNPLILQHIDRREYGLMRADQSVRGCPQGYTLYGVGESNVIELIPISSVVDTLIISYYREHYIPTDITTGSTASDTVTMDFPLDYQTAILASARCYYLADKGGDPTRLQYWMGKAEEMKRAAKARDEFIPDAWQGFSPSAGLARYTSPNDVTRYLDDW